MGALGRGIDAYNEAEAQDLRHRVRVARLGAPIYPLSRRFMAASDSEPRHLHLVPASPDPVREDALGSAEKHLLTVRTSFDGEGTFCIELYGELDVSNVPHFERAMNEAEGTDARSIVIDLSALEFIDSIGIRALLAATRRSAASGFRLRLLRGRDSVQRAIVMCGVAEHLPFAD